MNPYLGPRPPNLERACCELNNCCSVRSTPHASYRQIRHAAAMGRLNGGDPDRVRTRLSPRHPRLYGGPTCSPLAPVSGTRST
jgi:hypothetical protein